MRVHLSLHMVGCEVQKVTKTLKSGRTLTQTELAEWADKWYFRFVQTGFGRGLSEYPLAYLIVRTEQQTKVYKRLPGSNAAGEDRWEISEGKIEWDVRGNEVAFDISPRFNGESLGGQLGKGAIVLETFQTFNQAMAIIARL